MRGELSENPAVFYRKVQASQSPAGLGGIRFDTTFMVVLT
jgi:hypothetical protein